MSPERKTLLALEHHAKPLQPLVAVLSFYALARGWKPHSSHRGANSWYLIKDNPWKQLRIAGRRNRHNGKWWIEINKKTILHTRSDAIRWAEANL